MILTCSPPVPEANSFSLIFVLLKEQLLQVMGSSQVDASLQASHMSFKGEARVAVDDDEEEEQDSSSSSASVDKLDAAKAGVGPIGRRSSRVGSSVTDISSNASINYRRTPRQDRIGSESFLCGAFCMHLPGLSSRRRPVQQSSMSLSEPDARASTAGPDETATRASVVSKVASMERFEYGSSSSGAMVFDRVDEEEEEQETSAYFDLPLELLRSSSVDMESPVTAAFVFDGRGMIKNNARAELPDLDFSFPAPPAFSNP